MRRLYIGGLSHSVTQKDLKDRFGKFGDVQDVELRTRRDEEGIPYKTFGYININISEADLKKCLTVLNKSKWKGGTLQIEPAKESFLHRLSEERQAAAEQCVQQPAAEDKRQKMLDSLSSAGVDNFTMKAAVPGTEVPGHKDWVVSKFGRVLPVLQLRHKKGSRARTMKYDPSKYCHNIRRLDCTSIEQHLTPVTQLTWEVQGGDDDISKKRRGEFPPYEPSRPKKTRTDMLSSYNTMSASRQAVDSVSHTEAHQFTNGCEQSTDHRLAQRRRPVMHSDVDSEEEIQRLVAAQNTSRAALWQEVDEDNLEVVGHDYTVKSRLSVQQQKGCPDDEEQNDYDSADTDELFASRKPPAPQEGPTLPSAEHLPGNSTDRKRKTKKKMKSVEDKGESSGDEDGYIPRKPCSTQQKGNSNKQNAKLASLRVVKPPLSESDSDDEYEDEEEIESDDYSSDSYYESMFSNVTHLEMSLADLQKLAEGSQQTSKTTTPSVISASSEQETNLSPSCAERHAPKKGTMPEEILAALLEEDSEDEQKKKKKKRKIVMSTPLPAFQGTRALDEGSETEQCQKRQKEEDEEKDQGGRGNEVKKQKLDSKSSKNLIRQKHVETEEKTSESSEEEEEEEEEGEAELEEKENMAAPRVLKVAQTKAVVETEKAESGSTSESDDDEEDERMRVNKAVLTAKVTAKAIPSSSSSSAEEVKDEQELISAKDAMKAAPALHSMSSSDDDEEEEEEEEEEEKHAPPQVPLGAEEEEERQKKANMRRLAAVQQRQKEAEEQKKLIQGALAKLDAPAAAAGKHIVFGSDDDEDDADDEDKQHAASIVTTSKKMLFQDNQSEDEATSNEASTNEKSTRKDKVQVKPSVPQLFSGSEDEESGDEEVDGRRFDIRPQFEGREGQKLMELQSRFGTDERFRMDSRFLEKNEGSEEESEKKRSLTEEDEALEDEKKKNLSILQSVLGGIQPTCSSKTANKAKTFRDVSALHYDPSREEHAAFETKSSETKESKSVRRKKREEAQKLPEVSKEIYYDVSGDLKAVFGQTKDENTEGEEKMNWDQEEEEEEGGEEDDQPVPLSSLPSADPSTEKEKSSGFKFSFFGDDSETGSGETEYKVESIQASKVSWQQDPRFHDSSSDEDEDEEEREEDVEQSSAVAQSTEEGTPSKTDVFFFFFPGDSRLTDGPRLFCRSSHLEEQREQWEERRNILRQEYRKKHKDARRKLKSSQKS